MPDCNGTRRNQTNKQKKTRKRSYYFLENTIAQDISILHLRIHWIPFKFKFELKGIQFKLGPCTHVDFQKILASHCILTYSEGIFIHWPCTHVPVVSQGDERVSSYLKIWMIIHRDTVKIVISNICFYWVVVYIHFYRHKPNVLASQNNFIFLGRIYIESKAPISRFLSNYFTKIISSFFYCLYAAHCGMTTRVPSQQYNQCLDNFKICHKNIKWTNHWRSVQTAPTIYLPLFTFSPRSANKFWMFYSFLRGHSDTLLWEMKKNHWKPMTDVAYLTESLQ